ncbi:NUDIX hydrolase [Novosphingobium lentum]|uniref:NUDIX hydrolase n=1 Tax=Novosphingobium lentum TaxID=145287 RepID=UPI0008324534|nr:NUDIX domain-containing protein [Novosphingobium lentum]
MDVPAPRSAPVEATPVEAPRRIRRAARILLLDGAEHLLLFRFTPDDRPPFWATPGGECDPGEDFADAARRELLEETGIAADPGEPIAARGNDFITFHGEPVTADERFFVIRVASGAIDTSGHTAMERAVMQDHRWFSRDDIAGWHEPVVPRDILSLLNLAEAP